MDGRDHHVSATRGDYACRHYPSSQVVHKSIFLVFSLRKARRGALRGKGTKFCRLGKNFPKLIPRGGTGDAGNPVAVGEKKIHKIV